MFGVAFCLYHSLSLALRALSLSRTPDKGCVPCFYDDTIFYFHLSENNIFVCGLDQENPNTIHFISCDGEIDS